LEVVEHLDCPRHDFKWAAGRQEVLVHLGHAAAAVGAPTLSLFGPTDARRYAPWGPRVRVVRAGQDMAALDVETAYAAAEGLLASSRP
jgi:ADP-heptose:LPS heptosyltransferase